MTSITGWRELTLMLPSADHRRARECDGSSAILFDNCKLVPKHRVQFIKVILVETSLRVNDPAFG